MYTFQEETMSPYYNIANKGGRYYTYYNDNKNCSNELTYMDWCATRGYYIDLPQI